MKTVAFFVIAFVFANAAGALAHDGAGGVVKARMELMKMFGTSMKTMKGYVTGAVPFDADGAARTFGTILLGSGDRMTKMFPQGSHQFPTEALPSVWQRSDEFKALAADLKAVTAKVLAAKPLTPETAMAGFRDVAKVCKGCHEDFRMKKQ